MTPVDVLREFAGTLVSWEVHETPSACHLVEIDKEGAHIVQASLQTKGGRFPALLVFQQLNIPDVMARDEEAFQTQLKGLLRLGAFRSLVRQPANQEK